MKCINGKWVRFVGRIFRGTRHKVYNKGFCAGDAECERRRAQMARGKLDFSASRKSRHYPA